MLQNENLNEAPTSSTIDFIDCEPQMGDFKADVINGLTSDSKTLPPKYFYDERGSKLFDKITSLDEYYITRAEKRILKDRAGEIADYLGENCLLIEFGSGSSDKVRLLLDRLQSPAGLVSVDISKDFLIDAAEKLAQDYEAIPVTAVCADYTQDIPGLSVQDHGKKVGFFPGSTIGNMPKSEAREFLDHSRKMLDEGGELLVGVDLKKDPQTLEAAYNDEKGVTAEFNRNILRRMNRELGANFDLDDFDHHAYYNHQKGRVEMHLVSLKDQNVAIGETQIQFQKGESIHTENSYKYSLEDFKKLAASAGFQVEKVWTDPNRLFSVQLLTADAQ